MAEDFVLYNVDEFYSPLTFSTVDEVKEYGKKIGLNPTECDDFVTKVYNYQIGEKFEFKGMKFIVWDEEWGGYHQFHDSGWGFKASTKKSKSVKKMTFTDRVISYIKANYDIPDKMEFYIGTEGYDFKDWVDAYIEEYNNNVSSPYGDDSDESDVKVVGEEILQIMTAPYKMGNEYVINNDDFEASTKKSQPAKKSQPTTKSFNDIVKEQRNKNIGKMRGTVDSDNGDLVENYETVLSFLEDCYGWRQDSRLAQAIDLIRSLKNDAEEGMF